MNVEPVIWPPLGAGTVRFTHLPGDGIALAADVRGDPAAPLVVLLPGGGQTRHAWRHTAAELARRGWCALSVDLRGHGDSDRSPDGYYSYEVYHRDVESVVRALPRTPVLIGASLGGAASLLAAGGGARGAIRALVLVDIAHRSEPDGARRITSFMSDSRDGFGSIQEASDAIAAFQPDRPRPRDPYRLRRNLRWDGHGRWRWHWDERFLDVGDPPPTALSAAARRLKLPTLLVRGGSSEVITPQIVREFRELVPHVELAEVPETGHMIVGENNDAFSDVVLGFLERHHALREATSWTH